MAVVRGIDYGWGEGLYLYGCHACLPLRLPGLSTAPPCMAAHRVYARAHLYDFLRVYTRDHLYGWNLCLLVMAVQRVYVCAYSGSVGLVYFFVALALAYLSCRHACLLARLSPACLAVWLSSVSAYLAVTRVYSVPLRVSARLTVLHANLYSFSWCVPGCLLRWLLCVSTCAVVIRAYLCITSTRWTSWLSLVFVFLLGLACVYILRPIGIASLQCFLRAQHLDDSKRVLSWRGSRVRSCLLICRALSTCCPSQKVVMEITAASLVRALLAESFQRRALIRDLGCMRAASPPSTLPKHRWLCPCASVRILKSSAILERGYHWHDMYHSIDSRQFPLRGALFADHSGLSTSSLSFKCSLYGLCFSWFV